MNPLSAIIIDDETKALERLKILLSKFSEIGSISTYHNSEEALKEITEHKPDLVFLDIEMPEESGLEVFKEIKRASNLTKVIFYTGHGHYAIKAVNQGAFGYLLKPADIDDLKALLDRYLDDVQLDFTAREIEILSLLAGGKISKEIADILSISKLTVDSHRRNMINKLRELKDDSSISTPGLVAYAKEVGVV